MLLILLFEYQHPNRQNHIRYKVTVFTDRENNKRCGLAKVKDDFIR
jgi:hypothetical protein